MSENIKYYNAYNDRYKVIHSVNSTWAANISTPIVAKVLKDYNVSKQSLILEIGCGEGRDSIEVLKSGYNLLASDVSSEAIRFCKEKYQEFSDKFIIVDAVKDELPTKFAFIFATAVLHMLTEDEDRKAFWNFIDKHLQEDGIALVLTMGDGISEFSTDPSKAFELQERTNNYAKIPVVVTNTTCRMVNFDTLEKEIKNAELKILDSGITQALPDFSSLMYVVVSK